MYRASPTCYYMQAMNSTEQGIGILGCGAIGRGLALAVDGGAIRRARVVALYDQDAVRLTGLAERLSSRPSMPVTQSKRSLQSAGVTLVVEAASQEAVRRNAEAVLASGRDLMIMSTGALLDGDLYSRLDTVSAETGCRVYAPSGALGGIDAVRASRHELEEVTLTTRKPPASLVDSATGRNMGDITSATVVFEGNASEAVARFPFNINVAATLSLAGLGPERTRVRIIADPEAKGNNHEVYAAGRSGTLRFTMENVPHPDNPMTSHLAVLSAIETLRRHLRGRRQGWGLARDHHNLFPLEGKIEMGVSPARPAA